MYVSKAFELQQLQAAAQRTANAYAEIANQIMGCTLPIPVPLSFDLQNTDPKAAGMAHGTLRVQINMILFEDNVAHILNETLPHEIGHLVQYNKFDHKGADTQGHGAEWQEIMRRLGKTPHKFHTLDVTRSMAHFRANKKKIHIEESDGE
jgi:hypothetical protein